MGCSIPCDHAPTYIEGFFDWNGLQEVDQPRSAEERSITIFLTPMIEQAMSSRISCDKIGVKDKDDRIAISHIFLRHHLHIMIVEWKLGHSCHALLIVE